ncbi:SDR family NAD(P)-dependent oxidoreductase [Mycobacterium sp.]|uniref:SDR family NAD(P)-dependent oxidoreductase n=1 Tax=Mycobacterium sp. TaxID=1785 RepID=UPI0025F39EFA|nr:SDR family NAD(P)-dependent oxidoreductase [Mycobacterium sp.]
MRELTGRVAVVTGAGGGIGREVALELARRGCAVAVVDVRRERAEATRDLLLDSGIDASAHLVDVSDADQMADLVGEVVAHHGAVHILVNNAGVTSAGSFTKESLDDLRWIVGINLWGVVHGCHAFLPVLLEQDEAHIVNVSSMVGILGLPHNASYAMTKGAVRSFSEALRGELVSTDVGLTTVFPGAHRTGITDTARGSHRDLLSQMGSSRIAPVAMRSPARLARRIVDAIAKDKARVVAGPDAHALDLWARVAPGRTRLIGRFTGRMEASAYGD